MKNFSKKSIQFFDLIQHIPYILPKTPHLFSGLKQAYRLNEDENCGLGITFEKIAKEKPNTVAVIDENQKLTYKQLNEYANQYAHLLLAQGLKKGDVIALYMSNRMEFLALCLACAKTGVVCALVPLTTHLETLKTIIKTSRPKAVFTEQSYTKYIKKIRSDLEIPSQNFFWISDFFSDHQSHPPSDFLNMAFLLKEVPKFNPSTTASIHGKNGLFYLYTSGTTGTPKAALITQSKWQKVFSTYGYAVNLHQRDVLLSTLPLQQGTAIIVCWASVLAGSGTLAITRNLAVAQFWEIAKKVNAKAMAYTGDLCRQLLEHPPSSQDQNHKITKMIGHGLRSHHWKKFKARFYIYEVFEFYTSSESNIGFNNLLNLDNTVGFSLFPFAIVQYDIATKKPLRNKNGYCQEVKVGEVGLLINKITRSSPFDGYGFTADRDQAVLKNVFEKNDAYFNSGDLMRRLGYRHAQFIDRLTDTFAWKNHVLSTHEISSLLCECPSISEAIVYGVEFPNTSDHACMATIVLSKENSPIFDCEKILLEFKKVLPEHAIPLFLRIQIQQKRTSAFKLSKKILKQQGFNPYECDDLLLVWQPQTRGYHFLTREMYQDIQDKKVTF